MLTDQVQLQLPVAIAAQIATSAKTVKSVSARQKTDRIVIASAKMVRLKAKLFQQKLKKLLRDRVKKQLMVIQDRITKNLQGRQVTST